MGCEIYNTPLKSFSTPFLSFSSCFILKLAWRISPQLTAGVRFEPVSLAFRSSWLNLRHISQNNDTCSTRLALPLYWIYLMGCLHLTLKYFSRLEIFPSHTSRFIVDKNEITSHLTGVSTPRRYTHLATRKWRQQPRSMGPSARLY